VNGNQTGVKQKLKERPR